ncbi:MAG: EAL domain-containing protein [Magnetococcales bacterium]|nr:EAL domain-containing protein [Magnetococcales bacterium]
MAPETLCLVVDDDPVTRLLLERFLTRCNHRVISGENGQQALDHFAAHHPDIVLLDAKMPVLDGIEACRRIKSQADARHVPVLIITGLDDEHSVDRAFEAGASDYVTKPIHWAILRNRVRYLLEVARAERDRHLAASVFDNTTEGIVVTDAKASIQSVNSAFTQITGYELAEVVGQNMNLLKSGRHGADFYQRMWQTLRERGQWQGEIWNRRKNGAIYPQWASINAIHNARGEITQYVTLFSDLTAAKESEENLLYIAGHDSLTGLINRLFFMDRLKQAQIEGSLHKRQVGVLLLDLDRFKVVNDSMGHETGDQLLVEVGHRLEKALPPSCTLGRMGGDEFGIIIPALEDSQEAASLAVDLLKALAGPVAIGDMEIFVGASIGIAIHPADGDDANTLLKGADSALYLAKEQGRNHYQFFRHELNTFSMARMRLESGLRQAVERGEFLLYYQPQFDLKTNRVVGVEALMRWSHPERGLIAPGEFIPLAEETGLIVAMGAWALKEACRQAKLWQQQGLPPLRVAVNLSGRQFRMADFSDMVMAILNETGMEHHFLELELTESIAMGDVEETLSRLKRLSKASIRLSIDDFGTGFSSLSYLKRFPIDTLKIDRSFVKNCTTNSEDAAIIRAFIGLAHSLGLTVIAEGVETEEQLTFLRNNHCNEIQGFYISPPLPGEECRDLLRRL